MNYILSCIIGVVVGAGGMYLYLGNALAGASQMSYEVRLSNDLRAIEILESHDSEALRRTLISGLACAKSVYEKSLDSVFWQRTDYSEQLIQKLERYTDETVCSVSEGNA